MNILEEFQLWFSENSNKFICNPYIYKDKSKNKRKKYLIVKFEKIISELYLYIDKSEIGVWVDLEKIIAPESNDLLTYFSVEEKQNEEGKYYNGLHIEPYTYYDTLREVYQEELNNCFLTFINSSIKEENFLAVSWNNAIISTRIINPEKQPQIYQSYKDSSDRAGLPPTQMEFLLSKLVNIKNEKIISPSKEKEWNSKLLSFSTKIKNGDI